MVLSDVEGADRWGYRLVLSGECERAAPSRLLEPLTGCGTFVSLGPAHSETPQQHESNWI
jgi:hypothetical protein